MRRVKFIMAVAMYLSVVVVTSGCLSDYIGRRLVAPTPNIPGSKGPSPPALVQEVLTVPVGPPEADLVAWVIEPRPHIVFTAQDEQSIQEQFERCVKQRNWGGAFEIEGHREIGRRGPVVCVSTPLPGESSSQQPSWRGTVLLMHGWGGGLRDSGYLMPLAAALSDAGFRVVYLDLRAQGDSTGGHLTYGALDARDIWQVIDYLQARNLAGRRVLLIGHSYGAGVALAAAADPRVAGAISLSPLLSMRQMKPSVQQWARESAPLHYFFLNPLVTKGVWQRCVKRAGEIGGFDPDEVDTSRWIARTSAPVLLVHGKADRSCPFEWSQRILSARPDRTTLVLYDDEDHGSYIKREDFRQLVLRWVVEHSAQLTPEADSRPAVAPATGKGS